MENKEVKLEKKLSPLNVWALALGCIIGWGAFVMPGNTFLPNAGPLGTAIAMAIAALIMIIIAMNYHYMINKFPLSGGEFVYSGKAFGKIHGFVCAWFLGLSYLAIVPLNATALALVGRNLLSNVFAVGFHYQLAGYDIYAGEIILALAALLLFAFLSIRGVKFAGIFQTILTFALVLGVLIVTVAAILNPNITWSNLSPAYYAEETRFAGILAVVAVAPWAFVGFDTVPQSAEEFQFSPKKTRLIMIISILFGALVYVLLNTITAACVPEGYATWVDYINAFGDMSGLMALPTFYAAYQLLGYGGVAILGVAVTAAILSGIIGFYMATSRLLYAMSLEKVLPTWFGKLDPTYKTPKNAILFVLAISCVAPFFGRTALGWIVDMSSLGAAIGYGYTSAASFSFLRKEEKPDFLLLITSALGVVFAVLFAVLLLVPIKVFGCSLGSESLICLIVWIVLGILFYATSTRKEK